MKHTFQYNAITIPYTVIYRKRKTMAIMVEPPDKIKVIVPVGTRNSFIEEKMQARASWIIKKLDYFSSVQHVNSEKRFVNGESFYFLGNSYTLQVNLNSSIKQPLVELFSGMIRISSPSRDEMVIKNALEHWYRQKAREQIDARMQHFQSYIQKTPNRVVVKEQKKRWGSCSSKCNLNFNWRIIMAPPQVIDYIIVHEMSHLIHLNHSKQFWDLLASILPDYKVSKEWLKKNGFWLHI